VDCCHGDSAELLPHCCAKGHFRGVQPGIGFMMKLAPEAAAKVTIAIPFHNKLTPNGTLISEQRVPMT
jgi:hypothetical protein